MIALTRSSLIVNGRLAMRQARLAAARNHRHGLQIMTLEQAAARLAGGFVRPIDDASLRAAVQAALPETSLGELDNIKLLPGMTGAVSDTLHKVWRAGIDLSVRRADHPRLDAIARLEKAVLEHIPTGMLRPVDIVDRAIKRVAHAPAVFGAMEIVGLTELSPCWRPLIKKLATHVPVQWTAGPRAVPDWLLDTGVKIYRTDAQKPKVGAVSAATGYHEAVEAMRWARSLLASGVSPADIAIASTSPSDYDDHFLALRADANIDLHFVHGIRAVATRDGQASAALADIIVRGLSQLRLRRLVAQCRDAAPFAVLPDGWLRILPPDTPLATADSWDLLFGRLRSEDWPDGTDHTTKLKAAITLLQKGPIAAGEIGEAFLKGHALTIWRKALMIGPAVSIDTTIEAMKQDDGLEACVSVAWMPASALAASPRRFVRLLGLNSSRWPRSLSEDRLISDHVIPTAQLDPLPVNSADRRDFETILATTEDEVILSRARRDSEGRLLGRSPLLAAQSAETYLRRNATPHHAFSETDRLMARPKEFREDPQAKSARNCWRNWRKPEITPHDGLIRAQHPLVLAILDRTQSASSLRRLLRNPLAFVWHYALGWRAPQSNVDPLVLDALSLGDLVHMVLDRTLNDLENMGGLAAATTATIEAAVRKAGKAVAQEWKVSRPVPPPLIWKRTLEDALKMAGRALSHDIGAKPGKRSFGEVPFGGATPKTSAPIPWDHLKPVIIPDVGFAIKGYIDRLDIAGDNRHADVVDYKTGRLPSSNIQLDGGRELQRCLYAFAVKALLGDEVTVRASLLYPHDPLRELLLDHPEGAIEEVVAYLREAKTSLTGGAALPGPDTGGKYDDLAFALPANAGATYCKRKLPAAATKLAGISPLWEAR